MKNVRKPIRLPASFREMVTVKNLDSTALVQHHIDLMVFYPFLHLQNKQDQIVIATKIKGMMMAYQNFGKVQPDVNLLRINNYYTNAMVDLSGNPKLSEKQKENKSVILLNSWRKVISPLVSYPRKMTIEGGGTLYITFDYFLISLIINRSIRRHITEYMRYSSAMANQPRYV